MKFKLVEDFDRGLETQSSVNTLNEATTYENELAQHLMADMSNTTYPLKSLQSTLTTAQRGEFISSLSSYCRKKYNITNEKQLNSFVQSILSSWQAHHINGVHPKGKSNQNNKSTNIALVKDHQSITQMNKQEITKICQNIPTIISDEADKLIFRLIVVCEQSGTNPASILNVDTKGLSNALNSIPDKLTDLFTKTYPRSHPDVIYLADLGLSW